MCQGLALGEAKDVGFLSCLLCNLTNNEKFLPTLWKHESISILFLYLLGQMDILPGFSSFLIFLSLQLKLQKTFFCLLLMAGEVTPGRTSFQLYKYRQWGKHYAKFQIQIINEFIYYQSLPKVIDLKKEGKHVFILSNPHYLCAYP